MLMIRAYYHFLEEFKDVDYTGYDCEEDESIKVVNVENFDEVVKFANKNNLKIDFIGRRVILRREDSVFAQVINPNNVND